MKQEQALSEVILDTHHILAPWLEASLHMAPGEVNELFTMGFLWQGKLVGGLIFSDYRPGHDVWWSIYTMDKNWCQRRVLKTIFQTAFKDLKCTRINVLVAADNIKSLRLVKKLGFVQEGYLRRFQARDKKDCYLFSMLPEECRFLADSKQVPSQANKTKV